MSIRYQIKIVPDAQPNDDGVWIDVPTKAEGKWRDYERQYAAHIPAEHHMVAVQTLT